MKHTRSPPRAVRGCIGWTSRTRMSQSEYECRFGLRPCCPCPLWTQEYNVVLPAGHNSHQQYKLTASSQLHRLSIHVNIHPSILVDRSVAVRTAARLAPARPGKEDTSACSGPALPGASSYVAMVDSNRLTASVPAAAVCMNALLHTKGRLSLHSQGELQALETDCFCVRTSHTALLAFLCSFRRHVRHRLEISCPAAPRHRLHCSMNLP